MFQTVPQIKIIHLRLGVLMAVIMLINPKKLETRPHSDTILEITTHDNHIYSELKNMITIIFQKSFIQWNQSVYSNEFSAGVLLH
jgi:hypothetical protein